MKGIHFFVMVAGVLVLSACVTMPTGPSVMVLPSAGKSFEVFQSEDLACRNWAAIQTGVTPAGVVNQNLTGGAAIGALMGAGLGAAIGAASGNAGAGAAIGAGSGLIGGTAVASGPAYTAGWQVQQRYDNAYQQCMYAKGNQITGVLRASRPSVSIPPPPPGYSSGSGYPPPPPPGTSSGSTYPPPSGGYPPSPVLPQ
jgi:outer membrane lipoprotein SlyB